MADQPTWLNRPIVEALHADQIGEHGGSLGVRDESLLESAIARPIHKWHYEPATDLPALAAAYGFGIVKNHPFVDGNKRTGAVAAIVFLSLNGAELDANESQLEQLVLDVAQGKARKNAAADFFRNNSRP